MKKILNCLMIGFLLAGCAHKEPAESTSNAKRALEERWKDRLGSATKSDFTSEFGNAEWCKPNSGGEETCRFYKKIKTKWIGEAPDKRSIELFDEIIADFGTDGTLRQFKANALR